MKKILLISLFAFALAVHPAYASRIDLASTAGLGASVTTYSDTTTACIGCPTFYTITIDAEVFLSGGVYSYVYEMSTTAISPAVELLTVESGRFPSILALLFGGFNFGVIGAAADYPRLLLATSNTNLTFILDEAGLTTGSPLTVYVQTDLRPVWCRSLVRTADRRAARRLWHPFRIRDPHWRSSAWR